MATNKRKEAVALFELIGKSTLKVPKGGSLKIPSWWSSKASEELAQTEPLAKIGVESDVVQQKLFEPPSKVEEGEQSPSIRPPVAEEVNASSPADSSEPQESYAGLEGGRRVFAPQTMNPSEARSPAWSGVGGGTFNMARAPGWLLATGLGVLVIVLGLLVWLLLSRGGGGGGGETGSQVASGEVERSGGGQPVAPTLEGPRYDRVAEQIVPPPPGGGAATQPIVAQTNTPGKGKLWEPGTLTREPEHYYIWISATPDEKIARRNAMFLADRGVGVSIEIQRTRSGGTMYQLISEQGFASHQLAEPYLKEIRALGHQTPEYLQAKKAKRPADIHAWDQAFSRRVRAVPRAGGETP
ncbi:MAG: hypothetical protein FWD53_13260 [Phycisphaerales bacterium]|nr:hypothetical protein [Phycisphaerales bacterium]